ncbi:MAG: caspase family protein [Bacteroidales bacterium]|nr:caspase family protein [Bacteroidales bacterium]
MKRTLILFFIGTMLCHGIYSQQVVTAVSESKFVNITKDPPKPPYLEIEQNSIEFTDANGNRKIDANESCTIRFKLINSGLGAGMGMKVAARETSGMTGLTFNTETSLSTLDVGNSVVVELPVTGQMSIPNGKAVFSIKINEANGFGTDPVVVEIPTQAFLAPKLAVVDSKVSSQSTSVLQKKKPFDLEVLVQNTGQGEANDVNVELVMPANVYCLSANENHSAGKLAPGEMVVISYNLVTTNEYTSESLPFTVKLREKYGRYAENKSIQLSMNQPVNNVKLTIEGKEEKTTEIVVGSLVSSVDKNIPVNKVKNPNRIALIIGNENYSNTLNAEVNVDYARHDAGVFRDYSESLLGLLPENIFFLTDATAGKMEREIDRVTELVRRIGTDAELIFYYAGHGYPDEVSKIPYLIPVDVDATNLASAIRLSEVYAKFGSTEAARITVFLDACFSGGGRDQGLLAARSARVRPQQAVIMGNMVVFSASSGEQSALPYEQEKHGMFTFFLLKKLQESAGQLSYEQLHNYLKTSVGQESLRRNGKPQDPEVLVSPEVEETWRNWSFK